ncbi:hypothetical protein AMAG_15931 [Allomyces macrogynus ATCC 38327]|uniref:Uncharacterized protein n=1 Tax=Allomyces macrogynus (strain ATCC 38327) TaxID=578462 RepID=A0A0L0TBS1_ALLM3|nr:hypothetical protein AMAG_15931 [Allomyces macrogynus ATCC 38327]|eukprot:KNE71989.1 hypothetical protein AMAG_15931 [Allomyces macrogynus ATCC 38327]
MSFQLGIDTVVAPCAHWSALIKTTHLYEACRQYGSKNGIDVWPDMDTFMTLFDKDALFAGRLPKTAHAFVNSFSLRSDHSIASIASTSGRKSRTSRSGTSSTAATSGERRLKARPDYDLAMSGTVAPTRLSSDDANISCPSLHHLLDHFGMTAASTALLQHHGQYPNPHVLASFIEQTVTGDFDLRCCDVVDLYIRSLILLA